MSKDDKIKKMEALISNYNKLLAKRRLIEQERDELEKKAFKMLADHMKNARDNDQTEE